MYDQDKIAHETLLREVHNIDRITETHTSIIVAILAALIAVTLSQLTSTLSILLASVAGIGISAEMILKVIRHRTIFRSTYERLEKLERALGINALRPLSQRAKEAWLLSRDGFTLLIWLGIGFLVFWAIVLALAFAGSLPATEGEYDLSPQGGSPYLPTIETFFSPEQGKKILTTLEDTIQDAKERVYILIFSFTLDEIAEVIIEKYREGVDVKVIMDKGQAASEWAVSETLRDAGVPLVVKPGSQGGYMHIKALIADDTLFTGSYNYSKNATYSSDENFLIIRHVDIVEAHVAKFNELWGEGVLVTISPETSQEQKRAPPDLPVYITRTGEKYHEFGCRYLSKSCIPISLTGAKRQGYTPCKVCKPPS